MESAQIIPLQIGIFRPMPGESVEAVAKVRVDPPYLMGASFEDWIPRLLAANVNANRVASPDLLGQLQQAANTGANVIVCSVIDTDPSIPLNITLAKNYPDELAAGLDLLASLTKSTRTWIAADPAKPVSWFTAVKPRFRSGGLRLMPVRSDYPQSDPTLMLFSLLDRRLRPSQLPTDKRVVLVDTTAAVAVGRYVLYEQAHRTTPFAVHDHFTRQTHLLSVPMGTTIDDICAFLEIDRTNHRFRGGDFLRDLWLEPDSVVGTGELIVHVTARHLDANPDPCIRCGWCVEACPTRINPAGLLDMSQISDVKGAKSFGLTACIECGICSYVCPTRLPLLAAIRGMRRTEEEQAKHAGNSAH